MISRSYPLAVTPTPGTPGRFLVLTTPLFASSPLRSVQVCCDISMTAASIYNNQTSPDKYYRAPSPTTSLSPTLVNDTQYTERPSLKLCFPCGASNILNSAVIGPAGQPLYSILSNSKRTTMVSCRDNVQVAAVQWDRHSPRMVLRHKKMKCKEWLKLTGPDNEYIPFFRYPSV